MEGNQVSRDGGTIWSYNLSCKVKWRLLSVFSSSMVTLISADQHEWSSGRVCDLHWSFDISGIWVITGMWNALPQPIYNIGPGQTITKGSRYFRDPVSERHRKTEVDPVSRRRMKQKESRRLRESREFRIFLQFNSIGSLWQANYWQGPQRSKKTIQCPSCLRKGK